MASEPAHSDGLVGSGENLRQNVLLAASGTIDTASDTGKRDSHIDIAPSDSDSDLDKDSVKNTSFWQTVFRFRDNLVKTKSSTCIETVRHDEKPLNKGGGKVSNSITSLSTRSKGHPSAEKHQIKLHHDASHGLEDTGDAISELIGHIGWWQVVWVTFLIMFQIPSAFHIFSFMFQVNSNKSKRGNLYGNLNCATFVTCPFGILFFCFFIFISLDDIMLFLLLSTPPSILIDYGSRFSLHPIYDRFEWNEGRRRINFVINWGKVNFSPFRCEFIYAFFFSLFPFTIRGDKSDLNCHDNRSVHSFYFTIFRSTHIM